MASTYPGAADNLVRPSGVGNLAVDNARTHKQYHDDAADAIEATQAELGVNPAGPEATVVARLDRMESTVTYVSANRLKTSDTDASSTSEALSFTLSANRAFAWKAVLFVQTNAATGTGNIKFRVNTTGTATTMIWGANGESTAQVFQNDAESNASGFNPNGEISFYTPYSGALGAEPGLVVLHGVVETTDGGFLHLKWAQNSSDADPSVILAGSYLRAEELT